MDFSSLLGGLQQAANTALPVIAAVKGTNAVAGATTSNQTTSASPNSSSKWLLYGGIAFAAILAFVMFFALKKGK